MRVAHASLPIASMRDDGITFFVFFMLRFVIYRSTFGR
jgi:hypothetical protein